MSTTSDPQIHPVESAAPRHSTWLLIEGAGLVALGLAALVLPFAAGIAAAFVIAAVLFLSGAIGLVSLVAARGAASHPVWSAVSSLVAIVAGLLVFWNPVIGTVSLVLVIAAYLFVDGISLGLIANDHRRQGDRGWGWMMANAVADIVLGIAVWLFGPVGAPWLIGVVVGLDLLFAGVVLATIGLARRRAST